MPVNIVFFETSDEAAAAAATLLLEGDEPTKSTNAGVSVGSSSYDRNAAAKSHPVQGKRTCSHQQGRHAEPQHLSDGLPRHVIDHLVTKKFIKQSLEAHVPLTPPEVIEQAEGLDQRAWENRFLKAFERILMGLVIA